MQTNRPLQADPYDEMINKILPLLVEQLRVKSQDYGDVFKELGVKGQYSDMHRKMRKLKKALWDDEVLVGEQSEEILADLFGNVLIALWLMDGVYLREGRERTSGS
jgi:hypothetical protein